MISVVLKYLFGVSLFTSKIRDAEYDFCRRDSFARFAASEGSLASDAEHLTHAGPTQSRQHLVESGCCFNRPSFAAPVTFVVLRVMLTFRLPLLGHVGGKRPHQGRQIHWKSWLLALVDCLLL